MTGPGDEGSWPGDVRVPEKTETERAIEIANRIVSNKNQSTDLRLLAKKFLQSIRALSHG